MRRKNNVGQDRGKRPSSNIFFYGGITENDNSGEKIDGMTT